MNDLIAVSEEDRKGRGGEKAYKQNREKHRTLPRVEPITQLVRQDVLVTIVCRSRTARNRSCALVSTTEPHRQAGAVSMPSLLRSPSVSVRRSRTWQIEHPPDRRRPDCCSSHGHLRCLLRLRMHSAMAKIAVSGKMGERREGSGSEATCCALPLAEEETLPVRSPGCHLDMARTGRSCYFASIRGDV